MGIFNIFDPFLGFVFMPLLSLGYLGFIIAMSLIISLGIILLTKYTTNQKLMKELRDSMKFYQSEVKKHKSNTSKVLELQKKAMEQNMEYMRHSIKATLYSFIPIIVLLGWVGSNVAYAPIKVGDQFNVSAIFEKNYNGNVTLEAPKEIKLLSQKTVQVTEGRSTWALKSIKEGDYELTFESADQGTLSKNVLITKELKYSPIVKRKKTLTDFIYGSSEGYLDKTGSAIQITLSNSPVKPLGKIGIFGWYPGWLGTYIIFSIIFTIILRKIMKVY